MTTRIVHDCETGEIEEVTIPAKELKDILDAFEAEQAAKSEAAAKRQAVLDKLGITAEDLAALI